MKKIIKKIIYYIFLTISFLLLPLCIRNVYLSILVKSSILDIIINIISGLFVFSYTFIIAMIIRYNLKHNRWPFKFLYEEDDEDD
ncbi:MAG: hypothetical protein IJA30_04880 [Bacilli bacterium]|nr:hypothetical protein [Bacilli bacterium]